MKSSVLFPVACLMVMFDNNFVQCWTTEQYHVEKTMVRRSASGRTNFPDDLDLRIGPIGEEPKQKKLVKQLEPSTIGISRKMKKEYAAYTDPTLEMSVIMNEDNHMVGLVRKNGRDCILIDEFIDCADEDVLPFEMNQDQIDQDLLIKTGPNRAMRPSIPETFFAEICVFTDYAWFRRFERLANITGSSSALEDAQMFLTALFNEVNLFYTTLGQGDYRLIIVLQDFIIAQSDAESPWSLPDGNGTLESFFAFLGHLDYIPNNFDLDKCDHFLSFTGLNVKVTRSREFIVSNERPSPEAVKGIPASCCASGSSIVEDNVYLALITSHVLGHVFGAYHDQQNLNPECRGGTWVMTVFLGLTNVTTWNTFSVCSRISIGQWLRGGGTCFSKNSFEVDQVNEDRCLGFTGQMLTVEEQFIRLGGNGSFVVPAGNIDCFNVILCFSDSSERPSFPMIPPDGTMCAPESSGTTEICLRGLCTAVEDFECDGQTPLPPICNQSN